MYGRCSLGLLEKKTSIDPSVTIQSGKSQWSRNLHITTRQAAEMDEMPAGIFEDKSQLFLLMARKDQKDLKIIDAIYLAVKRGKKVDLRNKS